MEGRGDVGTGWSKAWKINLWARALDGDHAYKLLSEAIKHNTYPNLFDAHPPFQIDGNFGGTSGITEMLLQSQNGYLHILPALPSVWPAGKVTGLVGRGEFVTNIEWREGVTVKARIISRLGNECRIKLGKPFSAYCNGTPIKLKDEGNGIASFDTAANTTYEICPE